MARDINQNLLVLGALTDFDQLPDCAFVRQHVVEKLFSYSAATIWRRAADCRIPKPRKLSCRVTAWNVGQLRAALASVLEGAGTLPNLASPVETTKAGKK